MGCESQEFISDWEYRRHRLMLRMSDYQRSYEDAAYEAALHPGVAAQQRAYGAKADFLRLLEQIEFYDAAITAARRRAETEDSWKQQYLAITKTEIDT